jgi:hypothetical protein
MTARRTYCGSALKARVAVEATARRTTLQEIAGTFEIDVAMQLMMVESSLLHRGLGPCRLSGPPDFLPYLPSEVEIVDANFVYFIHHPPGL